MSLVLTLFLSLAQALGAQPEYRPDRAGFGLRGPVRAVKEEDYNLHADGEAIFTGNLTLRFDARGRLVELLRGNRHVEDLYDDRYSYRPDGRLAGVEHFFNKELGSREVYVYDDARRRVEVLTYGPGGGAHMKVSKTYDERGGETRNEMEFLTAEGKAAVNKQVTETAHAYDGEGRPLSSTVKDSAGRPILVITSERDAAGRVVTTTKDLRAAAQRVMARTVRTQDAEGNVLTHEAYGADGTLTEKITYTRKFDARGNWVEEIMRVREQRPSGPHEWSFLRRRTITYQE